ncbi:DEAD/DEAH box helicase family protein [Pseudochelatococcus sp. G4_1912]|uniref:restriction endonuclease n=1 Tax=Pseudochelatococcus sp. G4_1912 TaxID=3114288 RepID=UPI0039C5B157
MKLKFDPSLEYQQDAINAVVGALEGQPIVQSHFEISATAGGGMKLSDLGVGNNITLPDNALYDNIQKIQERNGIEKVSALQGREFSIEMETGTGKTYVYLRTIFELSKNYGLKKFIIVVPSVPIREGVLKNLEITKAHFRTLYDNTPFDYFVYDSKKLGKVRQFATSNQIQIMVINIQSFQKDVPDKDLNEMTEEEIKKLNVINRENDRMSGRKPIEFIQAANPIVIIDEPQSVDNTAKAKRAIANLNPAITLRYSATHRETYNLLYKLDPIRAYDLRLVKRIEVASIRSDDSFNDAYVKLLKCDNKNGIKAQIEIHKEGPNGVKPAKLWVKQGDDLYGRSDGRAIYAQGYIVQNIDCTPGAEYIEFNRGKFLRLGQEIGGLGEEIMREQVRETVEQHLKKEYALRNKGVKVLSLFFIDRVANYRIYNDDGTISLGKIGQWFEEAYKELTTKPIYQEFAVTDIGRIHNGYFSQDKQGHAKDSSGKTADDEDTYSLIMRDKERLLDPKEPLRFIFSHSALREGWDNPNVFQICTLNETQSMEKKRQEIGRGLRLPVNEHGERVHDESINRLTVIANESYEDFAKSLQNEFEEDFGIKFGRIEKIAFAKIVRVADDGTETPIGQEESGKIWHELKSAGYINDAGDILDKFNLKDLYFELKISEAYSDLKSDIIDEMQRFVFKNRVVNARDQRQLKFRKEVHLSDDFQSLWDQIKHRTRYRVSFDTAELIAQAIGRIKELEPIHPIRIAMTRVVMDISEAGVSTDRKLEEKSRAASLVRVLPDLLAYLQKETELTRHTLVEILKGSGRLGDFQINPQQFMSLAAREISRALHDLMLEGIQYERIASHYWEMSRIEKDAEGGIVRYLNNLYEVQNQEKCLFNAIEYESEIERQFAKDLDHNEHVRLFVKLPRWFKIDTPIGPYNPDWAFVTHRDEKLYFVRETKSTLDSRERRNKENQKILCGKRHFKSIGVDFGVVTNIAEVNF